MFQVLLNSFFSVRWLKWRSSSLSVSCMSVGKAGSRQHMTASSTSPQRWKSKHTLFSHHRCTLDCATPTVGYTWYGCHSGANQQVEKSADYPHVVCEEDSACSVWTDLLLEGRPQKVASSHQDTKSVRRLFLKQIFWTSFWILFCTFIDTYKYSSCNSHLMLLGIRFQNMTLQQWQKSMQTYGGGQM